MNRFLPCFFMLLFVFKGNELLAQDPENEIISHLEIYSLMDSTRTVIYKENGHFEAPNWSPDGKNLIINQEGLLYSVSLNGNSKTLIPTHGLDRLNNDHGPSPDGNWLAVSNNDDIPDSDMGTSRIYIVPIKGGKPELVTRELPSYWHGWSPDGKRLVYTAARDGIFDIYEIDLLTKTEVRITESPTLDDGPEYSPDGNFLYFNSYRSGSMEIWRRHSASGVLEQLTEDAYSNWFPHPSPDGRYVVYLSYAEDQQQGHPPMKDVLLRLLDLNSMKVRTLCTFTGGQGSINVPSWSPNSLRFAFVSYSYQKN